MSGSHYMTHDPRNSGRKDRVATVSVNPPSCSDLAPSPAPNPDGRRRSMACLSARAMFSHRLATPSTPGERGAASAALRCARARAIRPSYARAVDGHPQTPAGSD